jgi:hypothetical protein
MTTRADRAAQGGGPMRQCNGMLSADLLDANESTWKFVTVDSKHLAETRRTAFARAGRAMA